MVARFAGASLGLLAFSVTIAAGLYAHNPPMVTLSRSILALFTFCIMGLLFGRAAQIVIAEHERNRRAEIERRYRDDAEKSDRQAKEKSIDSRMESIGA
ncbi:MAG: hypothetical protein AAB341_02640 [Planctomycetota bacterium]